MDRDVLRLQQALRTVGLYDAAMDGIFGRLTLAGVVVRAGAPAPLAIAAGEYAVAEVAGARHNRRIQQYHGATSLGDDTADEVAWCSSFVNWCQTTAGRPKTGSAMARSWLSWGVTCRPEAGAVAVLRRGPPPWGHVGYLVHWTAGHVWLLGGNQGNRVSVARFPRASLLDLRKQPHA